MRSQYNTRQLADPALVAELFNYDPTNGALLRKHKRGKWPAGVPVGHLRQDGYWDVKINGASYLAHRVIWCLIYGSWPEGEVDHIDGNRLNNHITNLRIAFPKEQNQNHGIRKDNKTGYKGVFLKENGKYMAYITLDYQQRKLGTYTTLEEAVAARRAAETDLHPYRRVS